MDIEGVNVTNLSDDYRNKFNAISDDSHLNEIIYNNALEIIRKTKK